MSIQAEHVCDAFDSMLAEPMPAETIDVMHVLGEGRRRRTRRRAGRAAAGVVTACLVGTLVPTLLAGHNPAAQVNNGPAATSAAPTTDPLVDPLVPTASFGWLPAQLNQVTYMGNATEQAEIGPAPSNHSKGLGSVSLATGGWVQSQTSTKGMRTAGLINGHPAYARSWAPGTHGTGTVGGNQVFFQSATGQWAQLTGYVLPEADTLKIAQHMVFSAPKAIPLPFQWNGQSANSDTATGSFTTVDGKFTSGSVHIQVNGETVSVDALPADSTATGVVNDSIPKKPATRIMNGLKIVITISSQSNTTPVTGDPTSYFKDVTSLGLNPAHWTTNVFPTPTSSANP